MTSDVGFNPLIILSIRSIYSSILNQMVFSMKPSQLASSSWLLSSL